MKEKVKKEPSLFLALIPIIFLVCSLGINVYLFKDNASYGPNQITLLVCGALATLLGMTFLNCRYAEIEKKILDTIYVSMQANLILLIVGALIGVWILSGIVPTMVYYGIKLINPSIFLPLSCLVCVIVSLATGSSWSTGGTVGIALIGIGQSLGFSVPMVAGAVISGSYFGDKLSPLSDTTNLAAAVAGAELFDHVKHMLYTTIPALIIALIGFSFLSFSYGNSTGSLEQLQELLSLMREQFNISLWLLLVPFIVIVMVIKKIPAIPALAFGVILGAIAALIFQQELLSRLSPQKDLNFFLAHYKVLMDVSFDGFKMETSNSVINSLFSKGGMAGMLNTIWLILVAMSFGGVLEATGMIQRISKSIMKLVRGGASLVTSSVLTSIFLNMTASEQYLSIVLTGRVFKGTFEKFNLKAKNFSRTIEDGATVTSVLVPWNSGGAYFASILGIATLDYLPYAFFNLACPIVAIVCAILGFGQEKIDETAS